MAKRIKVFYRKLGKENLWGAAYSGENRIEIDPRTKGKKYLEILNHEILHVLFPDLSEEEIVEKSILMTNTHWHEGIRRVDNHCGDPLQDGSK
jgi:hypothetical protein